MWNIVKKFIPWQVKYEDESMGFVVYDTFYGGESVTINLLIEEVGANRTKVIVIPTFPSLAKLSPGKAEKTVLQMLSSAVEKEKRN